MKQPLSMGLAALLLAGLSACAQHRATNSELIQAALSDPARSAADRQRDQRSHPEEILRLLDIGRGDAVFDVFGGGGYYAELIARVVGPQGRVYLHNNNAYLKYVGEALDKRLAAHHPPQLLRHDRETYNLDIAPDSLDAAMIIMSFHDLFFADEENGWCQIDYPGFMQQIRRGLKADGVFLIVDHVADAGSGIGVAQSLHRIEPDYAVRALAAQGFELVDHSDVLRNAQDDHSSSVFDPAIRGNTDRFVMLFRKSAVTPADTPEPTESPQAGCQPDN